MAVGVVYTCLHNYYIHVLGKFGVIIYCSVTHKTEVGYLLWHASPSLYSCCCVAMAANLHTYIHTYMYMYIYTQAKAGLGKFNCV